jgi:hypothetical protein
MVTEFCRFEHEQNVPIAHCDADQLRISGQAALDATVRLVAGPQKLLNQLRRDFWCADSCCPALAANSRRGAILRTCDEGANESKAFHG